jgi:GT2 family glycosyltransferase
MKEVSIVIVNYNTFDLTCSCIESIRAKTSNVDYEVILVDNASTEKSPSLFLQRYPFIILITSKQNVGFAKGCNLGIKQANGKYILLLNSDTQLLNNAVFICYDFLRRNHNVAVVSSKLEYPDGEIQNNCQRFPSIRYGLFELLRLQKILPKNLSGRMLFGPFFTYDKIAFPDWVWGTFFMFKKEVLSDLEGGKLSEDFFMYVEDMQWCMDFKKAGYKIAFEPTARIAHFMGKSGGAKHQFINTNHLLFMKKYYGQLHIFMINIIQRLLTQ